MYTLMDPTVYDRARLVIARSKARMASRLAALNCAPRQSYRGLGKGISMPLWHLLDAVRRSGCGFLWIAVSFGQPLPDSF
jgi:hypothetical protein